MRVFLDANVYFSAARSVSGGSSIVCELIKKKKVTLYATRQVLREAERNVREKEPISVRLRFYELMVDLNPQIVTIYKRSAESHYSKIIDKKDIHVLEGARKTKVDFLVTLDRKHFLTKKVKEAVLPFVVVSPGELLRALAK